MAPITQPAGSDDPWRDAVDVDVMGTQFLGPRAGVVDDVRTQTGQPEGITPSEPSIAAADRLPLCLPAFSRT